MLMVCVFLACSCCLQVAKEQLMQFKGECVAYTATSPLFIVAQTWILHDICNPAHG